MNFSTYQWRADGGYLPPAGHQPAMLYHGAPPPYVAMQFYPANTFVPVPPPGALAPSPRPPPPMPQTLIASRKRNPNHPPALRPGMNYMFGPEHTHLHIFGKASKIWKDRYHGQAHKFKQFKVSTTLTVQNVISNVLNNTDPEYCKGWAVTEVTELGSMVWKKGSQITFSSDKAKKTLKDVGWDSSRGVGRPPVWLVVHQV